MKFLLTIGLFALAISPALGLMLLPSPRTSPPGLISVWELDFKSNFREREKRPWLNPARAALNI